jgi:guanylate kinase
MKIIIIGKSASGKTDLSLLLKEKGLKVAVSCTTREKRNGELDGLHYKFISKETFFEKIQNNNFIEYNEFNSWFYGLTKEDFEKSDVIISTPKGLKDILQKYDRKILMIIYLDTADSVRLDRLKKRGDNIIEIQRRFKADKKDFQEFIKEKNWDICINQIKENSFKYFLDLFSSKQKQTFLNLN